MMNAPLLIQDRTDSSADGSGAGLESARFYKILAAALQRHQLQGRAAQLKYRLASAAREVAIGPISKAGWPGIVAVQLVPDGIAM